MNIKKPSIKPGPMSWEEYILLYAWLKANDEEDYSGWMMAIMAGNDILDDYKKALKRAITENPQDALNLIDQVVPLQEDIDLANLDLKTYE